MQRSYSTIGICIGLRKTPVLEFGVVLVNLIVRILSTATRKAHLSSVTAVTSTWSIVDSESIESM